ncbi:MAG TPA: anhydro-N-acetylmuramic acid kinase [Salinivirgaceae bacterium]|nr:anhydro-N-acetylmuramic acid kinase [Salinivirgaceae bacterium]
METSQLCIGLMSGTSLDGLDIVLCRFWDENQQINYEIIEAETISYSPYWSNALANAQNLTAYDFCLLNNNYGKFLGECVLQFCKRVGIDKNRVALIASHGHTVFHNPLERITVQIGDGTAIYAETGIPTVYDFRRLDVAIGGQGAPLVPIGDELLFGNYDFCLNLGGFANVSYSYNGQRIAFDIVPVNIVLNRLAQKLGLSYDSHGENASKGEIIPELLHRLNSLTFYTKTPPKSLGREWVEQNIQPLFEFYSDTVVANQLRTYVEHISLQIARVLEPFKQGTLFVTGGGTHNTFLIQQLSKATHHQLIIPDTKIIDFKEALIFAFLGWLKLNRRWNVLASVTGAARNTVSGIYIHE